MRLKLRKPIVLILILTFVFAIAAWSEEKKEEDYKYVGSIKSNVYHYPNCGYVQKIRPVNLIKFRSAKEALEKEFRPCSVCKPPRQD